MNSLLRSNMWSMGPEPRPRSSMAPSAPEIYAFARSTALSRPRPLASSEAMALERVQPVQWVFAVAMR